MIFQTPADLRIAEVNRRHGKLWQTRLFLSEPIR